MRLVRVDILVFVTIVCCGLRAASEQCTQGFMDYSLLVQKASQIEDSKGEGSLSNNGLGVSNSDRLYAMPNLQFVCSGNITGFLLGVDIRIDSERDKHLKVGLLNVLSSNRYSKVDGSFRNITLSADNFSTSGLIYYELSDPIKYDSNQILGVEQPDTRKSIVRLYYEKNNDQNIHGIRFIRNNIYRKRNSWSINKARVLLHPQTKNSCSVGFIPEEDIKAKARTTTTVDDTYSTTFGTDRIFKDIKFTCDGIVTHVIIGTKDNPGQSSNPPEVRFWRSNNDVYTQSGSVIKLYYNNATEDVSSEYLRWYNLSIPVSVQTGDVLGIYHFQPISEADSIIYYQEYSGPVNYYSSSEKTGYNVYPLVSVVFYTASNSMSSSGTAYSDSKLSPSNHIAVPITSETSFSSFHLSTSPNAATVKSSSNSFMTSNDDTTMETPKLITQSASPRATTVESSLKRFMTSRDGTTMETSRSETSFSTIQFNYSVESSLNSFMTSSDGTTMELPRLSTQSASPDATTVESSLNSFMTSSDGKTMELPRLSTQSASPDARTVQSSSNSLMTLSNGTTIETHRSVNNQVLTNTETQTSNTFNKQLSTSFGSLSVTPRVSRSSSVSESPISERINTKSNSDGAVAGAVVSVIIVLLMLSTIAVIIILIWLKRKDRKQVQIRSMDVDDNSLNGMNNIVYQNNSLTISSAESGMFNSSKDATLEKEKSTNIYEPVTNPAKEMMKPLIPEAESDSVSSGTQLTSFANPVYRDVTLVGEKSANIYEPVTNPAKEMMKPLKHEAESDSVSSGTQLTSFANPVYGGSVNQQRKNTSQDSAIYYDIREQTKLNNSHTEDFYSIAENPPIDSISNVLYETQSMNISSTEGGHINAALQFGLYVPNNIQRQELTVNGNEEDIYGRLVDNQYGCLEDASEVFFKEEAVFWEPDSDVKNIYEQLARKRYREIPMHQIRITSHLGSGQFGKVDKGVWNTPRGPVDVAIKTLNGEATQEEETKFLQEAAINGQFQHPNIVKLCGVITVGHPTMIILEFMPNGDLKAFLEKMRPVPGELPTDSLVTSLCNFSHQVACGMVYLSKKRFVHRDLAARNILVGNGHICKIADFGMSRDLQDENYYMSNSKKIPVKWTAPEALHFRKYSTRSDVWSFGAVLYEIWSIGHKPFEEKTNQECVQLVDSGYRLPAPPGCPRMIYEMMIQCWHPNASSRPTFEYLETNLVHTKSIASEARSFGTGLNMSCSLYPNLQKMYQ